MKTDAKRLESWMFMDGFKKSMKTCDLRAMITDEHR